MNSGQTQAKQNLVMTSEGIDSDIELPENFIVSSDLIQQIEKVEAKDKVEIEAKTDENKK